MTQEPNIASQSLAIDLDALIAEKQKFFDEENIEDVINSILSDIDTDTYDHIVVPTSEKLWKSSSLKNAWRIISGIQADDATKGKITLLDLSLYFPRDWDKVEKDGKDERLIHGPSLVRNIPLDGPKPFYNIKRAAITPHLRKRAETDFLDPAARNYIFEGARKHSILPELFFFAKTPKSFIPPETADHMLEWCTRKGIDLKQMLADYTLPTLAEKKRITADATPQPAAEASAFDALIAEKQKFFDETSDDDIISSFESKLDADDKIIHKIVLKLSNTPEFKISHGIKNLWRNIGQSHFEKNDKKLGFITSLTEANKPRVEKIIAEERSRIFTEGSENSLMAHWAISFYENRNIWKNAFSDTDQRDYLFETARRYDFLPELYFFAGKTDTLFPAQTPSDLKEWCTKKGIDLKQMLVDYELPLLPSKPDINLEAQQAPEFDPAPVLEIGETPDVEPAVEIIAPKGIVNIVEVDGRLVEIGQASVMLAVDRKKDDDAPARERQWVPHVQWLLEDIPKLMDLDGPITLYRSRQEHAKGEDRDFSHQVIEFKTKDGNTHQIATNNWYGGGTYVIKPPVLINPEDPKLVHVPDLLGSGKAWPIRCFSREQFVLSTLQHCDTPLSELSPYIPRLSWANKAEATIQTCIALLKETGEKLKHNRAPLETGPLRGISTQSRMFAAINNRVIVNLGADNVPDFYEKLFAEYPGLRDHLHKPAVPAEHIIADAITFIRTHDIVPQNGFLDGIELAGHPADKLARFFAQSAEGTVTGWRRVLPDQPEIPQNLDAFMLASGLAVQSRYGELLPNYDHPALAGMGQKLAHG